MSMYRFVLFILVMILHELAYAKCLPSDVEINCRFGIGDPWCAEHGNGNLYAYLDICLNKSSNKDILNAANAVLAAIENKDGKALAALVHPTKGVRFSDSTEINLNTDQVFSRAKIIRFWTDRKIYTWGKDVEEEAIRKRPSEYILLVDYYRNSEVEVKVNDFFSSAHRSPESIEMEVADMLKKYPHASWVEYFHNHSILRLIFAYVGEKWFLVGVLCAGYWL